MLQGLVSIVDAGEKKPGKGRAKVPEVATGLGYRR